MFKAPDIQKTIVEYQKLGVTAQQDYRELSFVMSLLQSVFYTGVTNLLEIGCYLGGAVPVWSQLVTSKGGGFFISCDPLALKLETEHMLVELLAKSNVTYVHKCCAFEDEYRAIEKLVQGKIDLCILDTAHDYTSSKRQYELVAPMISAEGCVVFHDIEITHSGEVVNGERIYTKYTVPTVKHLWEELIQSGCEYITFSTNAQSYRGGCYGVIFPHRKVRSV